jgi:hypothetical protein
MAIYKGSRYQTTKVYNFYDGEKFIPLFNLRKLSTQLTNLQDNSRTYLWKSTDRIDILSYNEYGDSSLWWAIMDANPRYMSPLEIQVGDIISIPKYETIREVLNHGR